MKNERRKKRSGAVRLANAFEEETKRFNELPLEERESSVAKDYVYGLRPNKAYWQGRRWWRHWGR